MVSPVTTVVNGWRENWSCTRPGNSSAREGARRFLYAEPTAFRPELQQLSALRGGSSCIVGQPDAAGINRHVVGDERTLPERRATNPPWPRVLQARSSRCRLKHS